MRSEVRLAVLLSVILLTTAGLAGCNSSDSPTGNTAAPTISQLQVSAAQRLGGSQGLVGISLQYVDPDADVDRFVFRVSGGGSITTPLNEARQSSGMIGVQQAVTLPAAGEQVEFTVFVLDRRNHRSNELTGSFESPS